MTNKLFKKIGMTFLASALMINSYGCINKDEEIDKILKGYCGTKKVKVNPGEGYDKYVYQLRKENPQLKPINPYVIREFIKNDKGLKNKKMPQANQNITLPVYNCGGFTKINK